MGESASAQGPHLRGRGLSLLLRVGQEVAHVSIPTLERPRLGLLMLAKSAFFFWKLNIARLPQEGEDMLTCSGCCLQGRCGWPPSRFEEGTPVPAPAGEGSLSGNRQGLWRTHNPGR